MSDTITDSNLSVKRSAIGSGLMLLVLMLITVLGAIFFDQEQLEQVIDKLQGPWRDWALVLLLVGGVLMTLGFPGTVISVGSGVIYGFVAGTGIAVLIVFVAACGTFALARLTNGDGSNRMQKGSSWVTTLRESVRKSEWGFVAMLRLTPIIPFGLINFGLGKARIGWSPYLLGTALGIIPGTAAHVYLGSISARWLHGDELHLAEWALLALAVISIPVTTAMMMRSIKKQRQESTGAGSDHKTDAMATVVPAASPSPATAPPIR